MSKWKKISTPLWCKLQWVMWWDEGWRGYKNISMLWCPLLQCKVCWLTLEMAVPWEWGGRNRIRMNWTRSKENVHVTAMAENKQERKGTKQWQQMVHKLVTAWSRAKHVVLKAARCETWILLFRYLQWFSNVVTSMTVPVTILVAHSSIQRCVVPFQLHAMKALTDIITILLWTLKFS